MALFDKGSAWDERVFEMTRMMALKPGLFVGMSSGAAVAGALILVRELRNSTVAVLLPDRGDRYLSTNLFRPHCAECPP